MAEEPHNQEILKGRSRQIRTRCRVLYDKPTERQVVNPDKA
jgi:hypothetical protein